VKPLTRSAPALLLVLAAAAAACEPPPSALPASDAGDDAAPPDAGPTALHIVTTELPAGRFGAVYEVLLVDEGGEAPLRWDVVRGSLPSGAWLQGTGTLVAPHLDEEGVFGFVARVTDAAGARDERAFVLVVERDLTILTTVLPRAYVGHRYEQRIVVAGGRPPYSFTQVGGALPAGLEVTDDGRVVGEAFEEGVFEVRVAVTDVDAARVEADVGLRVYGPYVSIDPAVRDLEFCFARRFATVQVRGAFEIARASVAVRLEANDVSRLVLTVVSPRGTEVYLTIAGMEGEVIDTVFGDDTPSAEPLEALVGETGGGTWTLTLYDPRCPYPAQLEEVAIILEPRQGPEESLVVEGWTAALEAGRPAVRIAGGGLELSSLALTIERYGAGSNGQPEGGAGDDEWLGTADATWSTTALPEAATVGLGGRITAGEETGAGTITWEALGRSGTLPLSVFPPDWVP
jgi:hypothetical protein